MMAQGDSPPSLLLFDLGGVLVRWVGLNHVGAFLPEPLDPDAIRNAWGGCSWVVRYETGDCSFEEFVTGVMADLRLKGGRREFAEAFLSWVPGPIDGALELLDSLRPRYRLACLSNTNDAHWARIRGFGFGERFERCYLSFELGMAKPQEAIFEHVLHDLGLPAQEVAFFDDSEECIVAARRVGLRAYRVQGVEGVREALVANGL